MIITQDAQPSENSEEILKSLRETVAAILERKRKLGQYAVIWDGEKPVRIGDDAAWPD